MPSDSGIDPLRAIEAQFDRESGLVSDLRSLEDLRARYLSRKSGLVTLQLQNLRNLPPSEKAAFGQAANALKTRIEAAIGELERSLSEGGFF
jgi:phenylalanyl-tRNA synthetase alpha chain